MNMSKVHAIKIKSEHFSEVLVHRKTHEVRLNDRDYQAGDCLNL
ncbi:DUF3850 domain-containing protein [Vibrio harveyi]